MNKCHPRLLWNTRPTLQLTAPSPPRTPRGIGETLYTHSNTATCTYSLRQRDFLQLHPSNALLPAACAHTHARQAESENGGDKAHFDDKANRIIRDVDARVNKGKKWKSAKRDWPLLGGYFTTCSTKRFARCARLWPTLDFGRHGIMVLGGPVGG